MLGLILGSWVPAKDCGRCSFLPIWDLYRCHMEWLNLGPDRPLTGGHSQQAIESLHASGLSLHDPVCNINKRTI